MNNNRQITISTAGSRKATKWKIEQLMWSEFVEKLKTPVRSNETLEEYMQLTKGMQDELKDAGGFVAGELKDGRRKNSNVLSKDLITLDLDNIEAGKTEEILKKINSYGFGYVVYSTRKHADYKPRLRVVIPTNRSMTADEYEPVARKLGSYIGMNLCDPTTFEVARLMFYPSCSSNSKYIYIYQDAPFVDVDGILNTYTDWKNMQEWPQVPGHEKAHERDLKRQGDPTEKKGIVGAFCRSYDIYSAIENFIPGEYETCDMAERLTYTGGSTFGGAVVYGDGMFLYSHHATDPSGGKLCNAFDLVRLHLYGELDAEAKPDTPANVMPSYVEMRKLATADKKVSTLLNKERAENLSNEFDEYIEKSTEEPDAEESKDDLAWMEKLKQDPGGEITKTINNIIIILENDKRLKHKIALDEFANRGVVLGALPWNSSTEVRNWQEVDDSSLKNYLEFGYKITGREKIEDALLIISHRHKINAVKSYLESVRWDGVKRLETLLIDYLGAEDNAYTRQVMKVALTAAVARAITGSVKWDYTPIFHGPQGVGKSTFLRILGKEWFSDSLVSFEGKEAAEMIQGTWINELGELTGLSKSESNSVKQFLTKQEDIYREAYGRRTNKYPRRCVFFGTSNDWEFLKDKTGNRRFWPVEVWANTPIKSIFDDLEKEVDLIWAEAYTNWVMGLKLDLDGEEAKAIAKLMQEQHRESSAKEGLIRDFLEKQIPLDWNKWDLSRRRMFWNGNAEDNIELTDRDRICAAEIWCECLGGDLKYMKKIEAVEINGILESLSDWVRVKTTQRNGPYGVQKGFRKIT